MQDRFGRLFRYERWANLEEIARLRDAPASPAANRILAHIVAAQRLWLERLLDQPASMPVWPELTIDEMERHLHDLAPAWGRYLAQAEPEDVTKPYKNSKGETFTSRAEDAVTHVLLHGAYHRGQLAIVLRSEGIDPAYTDYVQCVRLGLLG